MKKSILILWALLGIGSTVTKAQIPGASVLSNTPPSIKWQQLNSQHFRVIFPRGAEEQAQKAMNVLEHIYEPASRTMGTKPRKFPIVIQNRLAESNGFVTVGPFRSELFTMSPQHHLSIGNDHWLEHLISHEYRHIVQFEKAVTPFNKALYFLFGELSPAGMAGLAAPPWFFEGDAVGLETAMGHTGRGRMPHFLMNFKANLMERGGYNYYKQYLRSFRTFIDSHYVTGYLLTTHLKNNHGPDVMGDIAGNAFRKPFIPFTFSNSIKKYTGKYLIPTYLEMMEHQRQLYETQFTKFTPNEYERVNKRNTKRFTNYRNAIQISDDKILAIKLGMADISQFVLLDKQGNEETVLKLGRVNNPGFLSANDTEVVWTEFAFDPRWRNRTFSVIKKLNLKTRQAETLTHKSRYNAAAISKDGKLIVASIQTEEGVYGLHLLDAQNGRLIKAYDNPRNLMYSMAQFDPSGEYICALRHYNDGKQIILKSVASGEEEIVLFSNQENIGHPVATSNYIFYHSNFNGIDNIYALNRKTHELSQVTEAKYGAFFPHVDMEEESVYYSNFTVDGHDLVKIDLDKSQWTPMENVIDLNTNFEKTMVKNENLHGILYNYPDSIYDVKKYNVTARSFRPISWGLSPVSENNSVGVGLLSEDIMNTTSMNAVVKYNTAEDTWRTSALLSYQRLFPIVDLGMDVGRRSVSLVANDSLRGLPGDTITGQYFWNENTVSLGLRLPLILTKNKMNRNLFVRSRLEYSKVTNYELPGEFLAINGPGNLYALSHRVFFSRQLRQATLDVGSRWGQTIDFNLKHTPLGGEYHSTLFSAQGRVFIPGIFKHHSIALRAAYQYEDIVNYRHSSPILFTRGYSYRVYNHFTNFSANYRMPLMHIDWHIGPLINFQRVYTNLFYDQGIGQRNELPNQTLKSLGAEVYVNFNAFRLLPLFNFGLRYSYLPDSGDLITEVIVAPVTF